MFDDELHDLFKKDELHENSWKILEREEREKDCN